MTWPNDTKAGEEMVLWLQWLLLCAGVTEGD